MQKHAINKISIKKYAITSASALETEKMEPISPSTLKPPLIPMNLNKDDTISEIIREINQDSEASIKEVNVKHL